MMDAQFEKLMNKPFDKLTRKEKDELLVELIKNYLSKYG